MPCTLCMAPRTHHWLFEHPPHKGSFQWHEPSSSNDQQTKCVSVFASAIQGPFGQKWGFGIHWKRETERWHEDPYHQHLPLKFMRSTGIHVCCPYQWVQDMEGRLVPEKRCPKLTELRSHWYVHLLVIQLLQSVTGFSCYPEQLNMYSPWCVAWTIPSCKGLPFDTIHHIQSASHSGCGLDQIHRLQNWDQVLWASSCIHPTTLGPGQMCLINAFICLAFWQYLLAVASGYSFFLAYFLSHLRTRWWICKGVGALISASWCSYVWNWRCKQTLHTLCGWGNWGTWQGAHQNVWVCCVHGIWWRRKDWQCTRGIICTGRGFCDCWLRG